MTNRYKRLQSQSLVSGNPSQRPYTIFVLLFRVLLTWCWLWSWGRCAVAFDTLARFGLWVRWPCLPMPYRSMTIGKSDAEAAVAGSVGRLWELLLYKIITRADLYYAGTLKFSCVSSFPPHYGCSEPDSSSYGLSLDRPKENIKWTTNCTFIVFYSSTSKHHFACVDLYTNLLNWHKIDVIIDIHLWQWKRKIFQIT